MNTIFLKKYCIVIKIKGLDDFHYLNPILLKVLNIQYCTIRDVLGKLDTSCVNRPMQFSSFSFFTGHTTEWSGRYSFKTILLFTLPLDFVNGNKSFRHINIYSFRYCMFGLRVISKLRLSSSLFIIPTSTAIRFLQKFAWWDSALKNVKYFIFQTICYY